MSLRQLLLTSLFICQHHKILEKKRREEVLGDRGKRYLKYQFQSDSPLPQLCCAFSWEHLCLGQGVMLMDRFCASQLTPSSPLFCPESHTVDGSMLGHSRKGQNHPALWGSETNPVSKPWNLHFRVLQLTRAIRNSCPWHGFLQEYLTLNDGTAVIPRISFLHRLKLWSHFVCKLTWIIT